jgi:hypothetical protein
MRARRPRIVLSNPTPPPQQEAEVRKPADFSDPESERVLDAAAREVARELGRQAARELWEMAARR